MQNPTDLNQAIQALQREMQRVVDEIKHKEDDLKKLEEKANSIGMEIKADDGMIRQKKEEILRLQQDMETKKRDLTAIQRNENIDKQEIQRFKLEQMQKNNAVGNLTREQRDALTKKNIKP